MGKSVAAVKGKTGANAKARDERGLADLVSVGPATLGDFDALGIASVAQLAKQDARKLYERLCRVTGARHDPCCEDVFRAAIEQARDPELPAPMRQWWYWSRVRNGMAR